jgi:hypothetical protein
MPGVKGKAFQAARAIVVAAAAVRAPPVKIRGLSRSLRVNKNGIL